MPGLKLSCAYSFPIPSGFWFFPLNCSQMLLEIKCFTVLLDFLKSRDVSPGLSYPLGNSCLWAENDCGKCAVLLKFSYLSFLGGKGGEREMRRAEASCF